MVQTTISERKYITTFESTLPCNPFKQSLLNTVWSKTTEDHEDPGRVRPPSPLFLHPTGLPLQWTEMKTYGIESRYYNGTGYCYPDYVPYSLIYRSVRNPIPDLGKIPRETDWALKLRKKIKDMKINLAADLVEYRQTAKMFGSFARGMRDAYQILRKGKRRRGGRLSACAIPGAHLTMQYGVKPLVQTLADSLAVLNTRLEKPLYLQKSANAKLKWTDDSGGVAITSDSVNVVLKPNVWFERFTSGNLLEAGWEAIPFSFVVDWGINVGDWLSSLDALKGLDFVTGTRTTKHHYIRGDFENTTGYAWDISPKYEYDSHVRVVLSSIPYAPRPVWKPSKSWWTIANGTALLWALNHRCRQLRQQRSEGN